MAHAEKHVHSPACPRNALSIVFVYSLNARSCLRRVHAVQHRASSLKALRIAVSLDTARIASSQSMHNLSALSSLAAGSNRWAVGQGARYCGCAYHEQFARVVQSLANLIFNLPEQIVCQQPGSCTAVAGEYEFSLQQGTGVNSDRKRPCGPNGECPGRGHAVRAVGAYLSGADLQRKCRQWCGRSVSHSLQLSNRDLQTKRMNLACCHRRPGRAYYDGRRAEKLLGHDPTSNQEVARSPTRQRRRTNRDFCHGGARNDVPPCVTSFAQHPCAQHASANSTRRWWHASAS
jgi:hypothetical protein